ncbi:MAG TPA: disulfide isomerase DsbC N-terminal domain-containing protein, partial [Burkholderiales bacterium]|nr:disulfide isomerase DsbC N-terminal domain-containing protein [Burkholderiales bacterium]
MKVLLALAALAIASFAYANEAQIRRILEPKLGGAKIEGVQPAPVSGLWEVRVRTDRGLRLLYTDAAANFVIDGSIHDVRSNRDLTEERLRKLNAIKFESLPLDQAVKVQRG